MEHKKQHVILVTGATGHQGGAVLRHVRQRGFGCRALSRDPDGEKTRGLVNEGVQVAGGSFDDEDSLRRALDGVYGAYSVQPTHPERMETEVEEGIRFAEAAVRAEVDHFVYSSVASADQHTGIPHFETKARIEERVRATGLSYTIVRPVFFMENWFWMKQAIDSGVLPSPLKPATPLQMIAVDDIGGIVAASFEHRGHWHGRTVELAGDELTMTQIAEAFSRVSGREVKHQQIPWDEFEKRSGHEYTVMYHWFEDVGYRVDIAELRREYPALTNFNRWLEQNWK